MNKYTIRTLITVSAFFLIFTAFCVTCTGADMQENGSGSTLELFNASESAGQTNFDYGSTNNYFIGPEDVVRITVLGQGDYKLTEEKTVSAAGRILLSIMQDEFEIAGMTVSRAEADLMRIIGEYYVRNPRIIVEVTVFRSQKILVIGEVKAPGEVILQSSTLSLKDLIIQSGGPVGTLDKTVIVVNSNQSESDLLNVLSLDELLLSSKHDDVRVQAGDIIYVLGRDRHLPIPDLENTVYVFGQVGKPGIIPFTRSMTVLRAIINAGNFTSAAAPGRTSVKRQRGEKIETINVNLDRVMSGGDTSLDIEVKPGDVIFVPRSIF